MARRYQPWYGFIIWLARTVLFKLTGGIRVVGLENAPFTGPLIVAPNHSSNRQMSSVLPELDEPTMAMALGLGAGEADARQIHRVARVRNIFLTRALGGIMIFEKSIANGKVFANRGT